MKHEGKIFSDKTIDMDFNNFIGCEFVDCELVYRGFGTTFLHGCSFIRCRWTFQDAAANTINFMAGLYSGAGPGGQKIIKKTFENIMAGRVPMPPMGSPD